MDENPKFSKNKTKLINLQFQEAEQSRDGPNSKKSMQNHIIIKTKDKKNLKNSQRKMTQS